MTDLPAPVSVPLDGQAPPALSAVRPDDLRTAHPAEGVNSDQSREGGAPALSLQALRQALADFPDGIDRLREAGDVESLARGLDALRKIKRDLAYVVDYAETATAAVMPERRVEIDDLGVLERKTSTKRTQWRHRDLMAEVLASGVYGPSLLDVFSPSWKVTGLRELGIDPSDFCIEEAGRASVQIHGDNK